MLSISILNLTLKMMLQVLFGLVRFHPTGSWNGWKPTSDGITDDLL
jgi:hypothetical protein